MLKLRATIAESVQYIWIYNIFFVSLQRKKVKNKRKDRRNDVNLLTIETHNGYLKL